MERTAADLQAQIDQLNLALRQWRETQDPLHPVEARLAELTERCADILNRWADTDHRHAHALSELEVRLGEWSAMEHRLEQDSVQRLRDFQGSIEHEWKALRQMHEEPVKELREQAAALGETCVATANLALRGFERAEARLLALETDVQGRLAQLSLDVHTAIAEMKRSAALPPPVEAPATPFSLEGVMRIHDELRETTSSAGSPVREAASFPSTSAMVLPAETAPPLAAALSGRMEFLEREVSRGTEEVRDTATRAQRRSRMALGAVGLAVVAVGILGFILIEHVDLRLDNATSRLSAAEQEAETTSSASRQALLGRAETDRQIAEVRDSAQRTAATSSVLAAPDLVRFTLYGSRATLHASAKVLWSRSTGIVLTASDLVAPPAGSIYQAWFLTMAEPVSMARFVPDAAGRVALAIANPPSLPKLVSGVKVTLEPVAGPGDPGGVGSPGNDAPSGATVLAQR